MGTRTFAKGGSPEPSSRENTARAAAMDSWSEDICLQTSSAQMGAVINAAHRAATTPVAVLLAGESGVGKKTLSRQIHEWSPARSLAFVMVDCASIPVPIWQMESFGELFAALARDFGGIDPQSWRNATSTIVLDNIESLCASGQMRLAQFVRENAPRLEAAGDGTTSSLRLIMVSNGSPAGAAAKAFFEQLLLSGAVSLEIPPLRERPEDILPLANHMLCCASRRRGLSPMHFSPDAMAAMAVYGWPGNLLELRKAVERAVVIAQGAPAVTLRHLPRTIAAAKSVPAADDCPPLTSLQEMERQHIARVLAETRSFEKAAATLGIHLSTLWRKRRRYNLMSPPAK